MEVPGSNTVRFTCYSYCDFRQTLQTNDGFVHPQPPRQISSTFLCTRDYWLFYNRIPLCTPVHLKQYR